MKLKVQKTFEEIKTALNEKEEKLLEEIDTLFNKRYLNEDLIKKGEKLPNIIKTSLDKGNKLDKNLENDNNLASYINDCINIENNIKNINYINNNIKTSKEFNKIKIIFSREDESIKEFIQNIKMFGNIDVHLNYFDDSLIIKNDNDSKQLIELLSDKIKINNTKLIYRSSRDGNKFKNVVDKLKNKSNLIFIYLTGNERIFGNYLKTKLENLGNVNDQYYKDENAFIFSLNNNKIYKILKPEMAIRFLNQDYPIWPGNSANSNGFYFDSNGTICDGSLFNEPKIYDFQKNNNELTDSKTKFNELEIFEIY